MVLCWIIITLSSVVFSMRLDRKGTVYYDNDRFQITADQIECRNTNAIACGYFQDTLNETGWSILEVKTMKHSNIDTAITDYDRMYSAGLLEGWLTPFEIYYNWFNKWNVRGPTLEPYYDQLINWTQAQHQWTVEQIAIHNSTHNPEYEYWQYANLLIAQLDGIRDGYNMAANEANIDLPQLDSFAFLFLNSLEEFGDLLHVFDPSKYNINYSEMTDDEFMETILQQGSCSAIIKVTPTLDDIFFAHSTWTGFYSMNRVYKHYKFDLDLKTATYHLSMSGAPATISSINDFYMMDSGLVSMETTNHIYNNSLWEYLSPHTLYVWQRAMIANALSSSGKQWVETFAKYNSGTYNNQWMVLNYDLFAPYKPLKEGLLWILEQIPGNCTYSDETEILEKGYWASYNVAALPYIYNASGAAQQAQIHGAAASYDLAPRARIFRRDANNANNLTMIQKLMSYNNFQYDALENNDPCWAIMCRGDLYQDAKSMKASGGIDVKIANLEMIQNVYAIIQNGPTHDQQPIFEWSQFPNTSHVGLPPRYNFSWIKVPSKL